MQTTGACYQPEPDDGHDQQCLADRPDPDDDVFLNRHQAARFCGFSVSTLLRLEREGKFAKRQQLSRRRVGWAKSRLKAWKESRPDC